VVMLNDCVTFVSVTPFRSNASTSLANSANALNPSWIWGLAQFRRAG
jgi:hypothetical protein